MIGYIEEIQMDLIVATLENGFSRKDVAEIFNLELKDITKCLRNVPSHHYALTFKRVYRVNGKNNPTKRKTKKEPVVYFIQQECSERLIKIGFTSTDVETRIASFKAGIPYKVNILKTIKGSLKLEQKLHDKFSKDRVNLRSEWFKPSKELLNFIKKIK